jgi:hypothetical protein
MVGDTEVNLCTPDVTFPDHKSHVKELKIDLASCMHHEYHIHQCLAVLEESGSGYSAVKLAHCAAADQVSSLSLARGLPTSMSGLFLHFPISIYSTIFLKQVSLLSHL